MTRGIRLIMIGSVLALGLGAVVIGCGHGSSFAYAGTWVGHRPVNRGAGIDPQAADEVSRLSLTLENGGEFKMFDAGLEKEGEYSVEGDHAELNVKTIAGQPMSRQDPETQKRNVPIKLTPTGDKLKYFDAAGFDPDGLVLERMPAEQSKPGK